MILFRIPNNLFPTFTYLFPLNPSHVWVWDLFSENHDLVCLNPILLYSAVSQVEFPK